MGNELAPLVSILSGQEDDFELTIQIQAPIDGKSQSIDLKILRLQNGDYELAATQADYSFVLQRTEAQTIFALPHHKVSFVGEGAMGTDADLNADGILSRLVSKDSTLFAKTKLLSISDPQAFAVLLTTFLEIELNSANNEWMIDNKVAVHFSEDGHRCVLKSDTIVKDQTVQVEYAIKAVDPSIKIDSKQTQGFKKVAIPRTELERQLVRSVSRATEILSPAPRLTNPEHVRKIVEHGELTWIDGQRVCILSGTPEEIGTAHGQLLKEEALKTIDSVLYTFGTVNTIRTGRWFRHDLNAAYERLSQHIPDDHKLETKSLAAALEID
ncbi:peptidase C45 acyl-coenzyme A:6-aminopenicillanic acid acyl-transferase, partial [Planctomicrobium sp.]|nr:peptidase C45 acyl-coenzyme A:6-aminopenicillanic acid acyl-transferase [Planctomicrobium sp.]